MPSALSLKVKVRLPAVTNRTVKRLHADGLISEKRRYATQPYAAIWAVSVKKVMKVLEWKNARQHARSLARSMTSRLGGWRWYMMDTEGKGDCARGGSEVMSLAPATSHEGWLIGDRL